MAKKKKKNRPEGFDPNQRKRERIEARRQAKAEEMARRAKAERRERIVRRLGVAALLVFVIWFLFLRGGVPDSIAGHEIEHYSTSAGQPPHLDGDLTYDSSPPVSGQHSTSNAACGTHAAPIEDEQFVHTMEHGAVAIVYQPTLPVEQIRQIEELVTSYESHTLSAPYEGEMETPIAVTAWAHIMRLDEFDEEAITEFIETLRQGGDAPEDFQNCPNDADDEFEPAGTTPAPGETPPAASPAPASEAPATKRPGSGGGKGDKDETPAP